MIRASDDVIERTFRRWPSSAVHSPTRHSPDRDDEPTARYCLHCETRIEECSCRR